MTHKILLIEDDATMLTLLQTYLQFEGFQVIMPGKDDNLEQTMESIRREMPAVILLDVYLHKFNGFDLLSAIRQDEATQRYRRDHVFGSRFQRALPGRRGRLLSS